MPKQMSALLTVENLTKKFGSRSVLSDVSFNVRAGEVLGLIGPNGAGKTTLFECLSGLLPGDGGSVRYKGTQLISSRRKEALFYLPDAITPWDEQNVNWVLNFFQRIYRQSHDKLARLLEPLRLNELQKSRLANLSKGERKRVLLALGLLTPHPLLLLDEPFDGLDLRQTLAPALADSLQLTRTSPLLEIETSGPDPRWLHRRA